MKPISSLMIFLLRVYRATLSPLFTTLGIRCRHLPTCSEYAITAIQRHGAWRGGWLTLSRLCRCHPSGSHGWDPAPETLPDHGWRAWRYGDWAWTRRSADAKTDADTNTQTTTKT